MASNVKQAVVVNLATPMSLGRLAAQGNHASLLAIINKGTWEGSKFQLEADLDLRYWLQGEFTKVYLRTWGEGSILQLKQQADYLGIRNAVMEEDGYLTAIAIGPFSTQEIDKITKDLNLF
jgi:peptidyl-tRNA hydrolase